MLAYNRGSLPLAYLAFVLIVVLVAAFAVPRFFLGVLAGARRHSPTGERGNAMEFAFTARAASRWKSRFVLFCDHNAAAAPAEQRIERFAPEVGAAANIDVRYTRHLHLRGIFEVGPCEARCAYPFGLIEYVRIVPGTRGTVTVLPRVWPVGRVLLAGTNASMRDTRRDKRGADDEFTGVREYHPGDERRHVYWRSSARLGRLVIKEFESYATGRLIVALDFRPQQHCGQGYRSTFEYMIEIAASLAVAVSALRHEIVFAASRGELWERRVGRNAGDVDDFLLELARVEADGVLEFAAFLDRLAGDLQPGDRILVICSDLNSGHTVNALASLSAAGVSTECLLLQARSFAPEREPVVDWVEVSDLNLRNIRGDAGLASQLLPE